MDKFRLSRAFVVMLSVFLIAALWPIVTYCYDGTGYSIAGTTQQDKIINEAKEYKDKGLQSVKKAMKKNGHSVFREDYNYDWCAWYIMATAKNVGLKKLFPKNNGDKSTAGYRDTITIGLALTVVNNGGGKIHFINKKYYKSHTGTYKRQEYSPNYKPRKGDIVMFGNSKNACSHVGLVRANSDGPYSAKTVEGNTSGTVSVYRDDYWKYSKVDYHTTKNRTVFAYVTPNYSKESVCSSHNFKDSKGQHYGKCLNCGTYFKDDVDKADKSSASNKTRYYLLKGKTNIRSYPADNSRIDKTGKTGEVQVLGTVGSWYKVTKYKGNIDTGYVKKTEVAGPLVRNVASKLAVSVNNVSVRQGNQAPITGTVSSNYVITKITGTLSGTSETVKTTSSYKPKFNLQDTKVSATLKSKIGKLSGGTYTLKITAEDLSGKKVEKTATVKVDGSIKAPTIGNEKAVVGGKTVTINSNEPGATLWYQVGNQEKKSTTNASLTLSVTEDVTIRAWNVKSKPSAVTTCNVSVPKLGMPEVEDIQEGDITRIVLKGATNETIMYRVDGSSYAEYKGEVLRLKDKQVLEYYAKKIGCKNSEVGSYEVEITEPSVPVVKLMNPNGGIGVGYAATFGWGRDGKASEYIATLYKETDDSPVDEIKTGDTTVSFTIREAGNYYVTVTARNDIGESGESEKVPVVAREPLTVTFLDSGKADEEYGEELASVKVVYGETPEAINAPSRRGYTFMGWENPKAGKVSTNEYLQTSITEDTTYIARYEKKEYKVRYYYPDGKYMTTKQVPFEEDAVTEDITTTVRDSEDADGHKYISTGEAITGWSVIKTSDADSKSDVHCIDSDMDIQAVVSWANHDLPVNVEIDRNIPLSGRTFKPRVTLTTDKTQGIEFYLVATIKGIDAESGAEKTLYSDRRIFSIPENSNSIVLNESKNSHDFDLTVSDSNAVNAATKIEIVALEKKPNGATGSTYSRIAEQPITHETGYSQASEWSGTKPEEKEGRIIETKTQYRYATRTKETKTDGHDTLSGYIRYDSKSSETTSGYQFGTPVATTTSYDGGKKTVKSAVNAGYYYYAYTVAKPKDDWTYYADTSRANVIAHMKKNFSDSTLWSESRLRYFWYISSSDLGKTSGKINKTIPYCADSTVKVGTTTQSGTHKYDLPMFKYNRCYKVRTAVTTNYFYRWSAWSDWSAWGDTKQAESDTRKVEQKTLYRYSDLVEAPQADNDFGGEDAAIHLQGTIKTDNLSENEDERHSQDLSGKTATIMVYQTQNTDPNKYQMQYTGQIVIGEGNSYDFKFIPKDPIDTDTGNYVVTLGIEGTTGLVTIKTLEAPKAMHRVTLRYMDGDEEKSVEQYVKDGEDIDLSKIDIPERKGYYFAGWDGRITNITSDNDNIRAKYIAQKNAVVFVDWINQKLELKMAETGQEIDVPNIEDDVEGYVFKGWKKENGETVESTVIVDGNMIVTADYEPVKCEVKFVGIDGSVIDSQSVDYGRAAVPPKYEVPSGKGTFVSWSTDVNWWNVEEDVVVRPVVVYDEQALMPTARVTIDENTDMRSLVLETEEEGAGIYYTIDGTYPTAELIQEYRQTADKSSYNGSINEYKEPITFADRVDDDTEITADTELSMDVIAVSYVEGKNTSEECVEFFENNPEEEDTDIDNNSDWEEIGEYDVKVKGGKDVCLSVDLEGNPGLTGYDFLIEGDKGTFYTDEDEYGDPEVVKGVVSETGMMMTSNVTGGWKVGWNSNDTSKAVGNVFTMTLHVDEEAEEGTYPITLSYAPEKTLDENYISTGLDDLKVSISSEANIKLKDTDVTLARTSYVYEGEAIEPAVRIEGLKEGTDYTVAYESNVEVGTGKTIVTGIGDYAGTVEKEFAITKANIANAEIADIADVTETGEAVEPELMITFNGKELKKDVDYEVVFKNNVEVGTADITITGIGNFKGSSAAQFNLVETTESKLEKAEKKLKEAEAKVDELTKAKEQAEAEVKEAREAQTAAETEAKRAREEMASARSEAEAAKLEKEAMEATVTAARAAQATAEAEAKSAKIAQQEAEARADAAEAGKQKLETELTTAKTEKEAAEKQAALDKAARENAEAQVIAAQAAQATAEANERAAQQEKAVAELQTQRAKEQLAQKETELADAIREKESLEADANTSRQALEQAEARVRELTSGKEAAEAALEKANQAKEQAETRQKQAEADKNAAEKQVEKLTKEKQALEEQIKEQAGGTGQKEQTGENSHESASGKTVKKPTAVKVTVPGTSITKLKKGKKKMTVKWKKVSGAAGYQIQYSQSGSFSSGNKMVNVVASKKAKLKVKKLQKKKIYFVHIRTYKKVGGKTYYSKWSATRSVKVK